MKNTNAEVRSKNVEIRQRTAAGLLPSAFCLQPSRRQREGIALVITLIMLAVTLVMAVAFLALARRERGSVTTTTDTTTARLAAESAVAQAEAQIVANMLYGTRNGGSSNAFNLRLLVSTNYINPAGYSPALGANLTNVSYFDANGNLLTGNNLAQSIANLYFLPRAPVLISSNEPVGRFYLDLNENRRFDPYAPVPQIGPHGGFLHPDGTEDNNPVNVLTNMAPGGDPEWVGVLEHPDAPHSANNHFISRYAFIALPVGNSLDINYIHNQALDGQNANAKVSPASADAFFRNQGVGSWEINLAAFLADLNTNIWSPLPLPANNFYAYNEPLGFNNTGIAFDDARALIAYRYNYDYNSQASAYTVFNNALGTIGHNGIDVYSDGPLQTTLNFNADSVPDDPKRSWAGANNTNHLFTPSDFLSPTMNLGQFTNRLRNAGNAVDTYDRYTYYRMLDQLGSDSAPDEGKVNLNYSNAVVTYAKGVPIVTSIGVVAGAETNLVPWRPLDFFLAAADQMLRTYSTSWFQSDPSNYLATYYGIIPRGHLDASGLGVTNVQYFGQRNQIPAFGITNIPVLINSNFVYTPAVNRLLQLAANLYDATTNGNNNLPHVFRPVFKRDAFGNVFIVSYMAVTNVVGANDRQLAPPLDVTALVNLGSAGVPIQNGFGLVNVYGVPWIIGAKKGLPNFNQFYLINAAQVTRKLQFTRSSADTTTATYTTNQMYVVGITNSLGVSFWNSYNSAYTSRSSLGIQVYVSDVLQMSLTNGANGTVLWQGRTNMSVLTARFNVWPGSQWSGTPPNVNLGNPNSFLNINWPLNFLPTAVYRFNNDSFDPVGSPTSSLWETPPTLAQLPQFGLQITNRLQAFILDGNNVIDYVQLRDPVTSGGLNQALADRDAFKTDNIYWQWSTNYYKPPSPAPPYGVMDQIFVSKDPNKAPTGDNRAWNNPPGMPTSLGSGSDKGAMSAFFNGFWQPNPQQYNGKPFSVTQNTIQAPYTPTRTVFSSYLLQANDPLVHYLASDLNSQNGTMAVWSSKNGLINGFWYNTDVHAAFPTPPTTPIGGRYQPWGKNSQMAMLSGVDQNACNLAYKDPLVWGSDNWDFPTNPYPTVGWIGRVHRGTPWQTVNLKSTNVLSYAMFLGNQGFQNVGTNTWANWTGDIQRDYYSGQFIDAANSSPVQDRLLFDVFTTRFNDNAVRGTLPVNQTHLASWSALFSGMVTVSNNPVVPKPSLLPASTYTYPYNIISPAGVDAANSAVSNIVASINATRANTNLFPFQAFTHVGDILQTPALTAQSPFLNWYNSRQQTNGISDELYEWLPQQMMGLVRLGEPRYVVYCYGQTLTPAPGGEVLGGPFYQLITNYQVTAESVVRAVIRVDNANTPKPHAVVESYNTLPPN